MVPMAGSRVKKILERIGCENVEDTWTKGEPVDDGAAKCDWLEEIFDDIPRLRENGGLLLMKTEDEVLCFEDTRGNRRELLNLICKAIVRAPDVAMVDVDLTDAEDLPGYYADLDRDDFEDLDRAVMPELLPAGR